jgi:hypothetical protein
VSSEPWTGLVRFAPVATAERVNDPKYQGTGRTLYNRLELLPGQATAPLVVNHDLEREIGVVRSLMRFDDVGGM